MSCTQFYPIGPLLRSVGQPVRIYALLLAAWVAQQIAEGRYASASEVVGAALRQFEDTEKKLATLRRLLEEGEKSGTAEYSYEALMNELDEELG